MHINGFPPKKFVLFCMLGFRYGSDEHLVLIFLDLAQSRSPLILSKPN